MAKVINTHHTYGTVPKVSIQDMDEEIIRMENGECRYSLHLFLHIEFLKDRKCLMNQHLYHNNYQKQIIFCVPGLLQATRWWDVVHSTVSVLL